MTKAKPLKIGEARVYSVDGTDVELTRVDPTQREYSFATLKDQQSRYEVRVDGVLRAHIQYPVGWGNPWEIVSLGRDGLHVYDFEREKPQRVYPTRDNSVKGEGRDELVLRIPALIKDGKLPTQERIAAAAEERKLHDIQRAEEEQANRERYARENAERKKREEGHRQLILEGLESIRDRLQGNLTNLETESLLTVIKQWGPK